VCHGPASTRYDLRKLHGLPSPWVDTAQARRRVVHLHGWGISYLDIARAAGIPASTVRAVGHGHQRRAYAYTVGAILAVDHHPRPTQAQALSVGAHRRVQALAAMGWPGRVVAVHLGVSQSRLAVLTARPVMSYRYWRAITEVYDRWGTTPGPSARCQSRARTLGWPTALAWESVDIDDPRTRADVGSTAVGAVDPRAVDRALSGDHTVRLSTREKQECARRAREWGWSARLFADRLGISPVTADRALNRARVAA